MKTLDLSFDLRGLHPRLCGREEFPEEHLLNRTAILFIAEGSPVLALRQRAAVGKTVERPLIEKQLTAYRLQERNLARLQTPPKKTAKQRLVANQWKLQRV